MQVSAEQLDKAADSLLQKSMKADDKTDEKLTPDDVAENTPVNNDGGEDNDDGDGDDSGSNDGLKKSNQGDSDKEQVKESLDTGDRDNNEDNEDELEKSVRENFLGDDVIAQAAENSNVMLALVEVMSKSFADLAVDIKAYVDDRFTEALGTDSMNKSMLANIKGTDTLLTRTANTNRMIKSLTDQMDDVMGAISDISGQMETFSHTPNMRKSVTSNAQVRDRNFQKSLGGENTLSKSQILTALTAEMQQGNATITAQDIIGIESGAPLRPELMQLVMRHTGN